MIRLVWRTDVHLSDTSPASRKDNWTDSVLAKLQQVGLVASKMQAAAILDGGDFFHVKSPGRNTHDLVRRVAENHAQYTCPVYANVGNHDCVYGDYAYLDQQPLGVLFATGVFKRCYDDFEVFFGPVDATTEAHRAYPRHQGQWVDGNPFEHKNTRVPVVRVVGVPYHGTKYDMQRFARIQKGEEDHLVCMAHVLASEKGGSMFEGEDIIKYEDLTSFAPQTYLFGHWHKDQGVTLVGSKTVVNIGSLTRGSLSQDEVERKPACAVLTFEKQQPVQVSVVRLKVPPASEVFDVEGRARVEARTLSMDAFVDSVKQKLITERGTDIKDIVQGMGDVPDLVRERVLLYLEQAGGT